MVYAIAHQVRNVPLARHAMRYFRDICHPNRFNKQLGLRDLGEVWWFLVNALHDYREEPLDWVKIADEVIYPTK